MTAQLAPKGTVAVIFSAQRTGKDAAGYDMAAHRMSELVSLQPGYLGQEHARSETGFGITVSYWQSETHAKAWRDHPDHKAIRDAGRDRWYSEYRLHVAEVTRSYQWHERA